jgi:hypothetical protein
MMKEVKTVKKDYCVEDDTDNDNVYDDDNDIHDLKDKL